MATADDIRAAIRVAKQTLEEKQRDNEAATRELLAAEERQQLRRRLEDVHRDIAENEMAALLRRKERVHVDRDLEGNHRWSASAHDVRSQHVTSTGHAHMSICSAYNIGVRTGEFLWQIEGMSWLPFSLQQRHEQFAVSPETGYLRVGSLPFDFVYNPSRGHLVDLHDSDEVLAGSLAIRIESEPNDEDIVALRYKVLVKRADGEFIQWGPSGALCKERNEVRIFGPDVQSGVGPAAGIFGLSHDELLSSEWVQNDTLTVKFELEVREDPQGSVKCEQELKTLQVADATLSRDWLSMLREEKCSDVTFLIQGERVRAHSQVLSARSEVFDRQFNGGMQESVSKEITLEDCELSAFKAFLRFLYTDDFSHIDQLSEGGAGPSDATAGKDLSMLQSLLAVSHKYQISRLRTWCEKELCQRLSVPDVCSILCQAHLYEAKELQQACLTLMKANVDEVISTEGFARLAQWPEVLLKVGLSGLGASAGASSTAVAAQLALRKRKREED